MPEVGKDTTATPTVIGSDTTIKGEMSFRKSVKIVGTFEGHVNGEGQLTVAESAMCKADVNTPAVVIDGTVEGNVTAQEKIQLNAKGVVKGDIVAGKMVMTEGASFFGQCAVGAEAVKAAQSRSGSPGHTVGTPGAKTGKTELSGAKI